MYFLYILNKDSIKYTKREKRYLHIAREGEIISFFIPLPDIIPRHRPIVCFKIKNG